VKKEKKTPQRDNLNNDKSEDFTQSLVVDTTSKTDNIVDYNRAWEDDRL
jgi:hypothetical protein